MRIRQGRKRGFQGSDAADITVWIISHIIPRDYMLSIKLNLLLSNKFGCQTFGKGVS